MLQEVDCPCNFEYKTFEEISKYPSPAQAAESVDLKMRSLMHEAPISRKVFGKEFSNFDILMKAIEVSTCSNPNTLKVKKSKKCLKPALPHNLDYEEEEKRKEEFILKRRENAKKHYEKNKDKRRLQMKEYQRLKRSNPEVRKKHNESERLRLQKKRNMEINNIELKKFVNYESIVEKVKEEQNRVCIDEQDYQNHIAPLA
ncbi:hypothetical protein HDU92_004653 [Lobulomyces angularis]|nr:hypothetical protein HDU92_004653 [Lobulomyces angularis]